MKRPVYFEETCQAMNFLSRIQKAKVYGTHTPCKNKHLKGLIIKYTNKTLGKMSTVLVTSVFRGEDPPCLIVTQRPLTAMAITEN